MGLYLQAAEPREFVAFQLKNVADGNAVPIALTGMLIVFVALVLISLFISWLPKILVAVEVYLPTVKEHRRLLDPEQSLPIDEERMVAAIGAVLYAEQQKQASQR